MENIKLLVAMHKAYCLPEDAVYAPIQVGGVHIPGMENALRDDTGENISNKNRSYCELTALYWGWKNLQADYLGLVHYRRYFARRMPGGRKFDRIASGTEIHAALEKAPVILPKKRNYWIETTYTQYIHAHHKEDLDAVQSILAEKYAAYLPALRSCHGAHQRASVQYVRHAQGHSGCILHMVVRCAGRSRKAYRCGLL